MTHTTLRDPITVAGIEVRTRNADELSGQGKIGPLWQRFFSDNILAKIPRRTSESLYVVYSDYESDENGAYTYLLGTPVSSIENLPAEITYAAIPTGPYAVFTTATGRVSEVVAQKWAEIWHNSAEAFTTPRAFLADYEIYGEEATDPNNAKVEIHVGLEQE